MAKNQWRIMSGNKRVLGTSLIIDSIRKVLLITNIGLLSLPLSYGQVGLKQIEPQFYKNASVKELRETRVTRDSNNQIIEKQLNAAYFFDAEGQLIREIKYDKHQDPRLTTYQYITVGNREIFITESQGYQTKIVKLADPWRHKILEELSTSSDTIAKKIITIDTINKITIASDLEGTRLRSQYIRKYGLNTDTLIQRFYKMDTLHNELISINYYAEGNLILTLFEKEPYQSYYKYYYIYDGLDRQIRKFWIHRNGGRDMEDQFVYHESGNLKSEIRLMGNRLFSRYEHHLDERGLRKTTYDFQGEIKAGEYVYEYEFWR